jgi:ABC-type uncharacterized transport system ATPase subunit
VAEKKIRAVFYSDEFSEFFESLSERERTKHIWTIHIIETVQILPDKFVKKLAGTEFYEMRVSVGYNEYRTVLFAMDSDNFVTATEIYLLNGFLKKDTKEYKRQIAKAINILNEVEDEN